MTILIYFFKLLFGRSNSRIVPIKLKTMICMTHSAIKFIIISPYLISNGILLAIVIMTIDKKNIKVTVIKQAKTYIIYLLIVFKLTIIGLFPIGCNRAAANLYISEIAKIFKAGKAAIRTIIDKPTIPMAFFNN